MIIYRGPIERSRLLLLAGATSRAYEPGPLIWLLPRADYPTVSVGVLETLPGVTRVHIVPAPPDGLIPATRAVRRIVGSRRGPVVAIGFSALPFAQRVRSTALTWCVQGIPEENAMTNASVKARARVAANWAICRLGKQPDLTVAVTKQHAAIVQERLRFRNIVSVPSCCDTSSFTPPPSPDRRYLTYLGSAAAWQGLDRLGDIWRAIHAVRPDIPLRVISKDERIRALDDAVGAGIIDYRSALIAEEVAPYLHESLMGFVLYRDEPRMRMSWPLKFSEYLAAGVTPVLTDMDWEPRDVVREAGVGLLVRDDLRPEAVADRVIRAHDELARDPADAARRCVQASIAGDRSTWATKLAELLPTG